MRNALVARDFVTDAAPVPAAASGGNRAPEDDGLPALINEASGGKFIDEIEAAEGHCYKYPQE